MRVQSINSNNYKNNDTGFKRNTRIVVKGLNCSIEAMCPQSKAALDKAISASIEQCGALLADEISLTLPRQVKAKESGFLVIDEKTIAELVRLNSEAERDVHLDQFEREAKELQLNWNDICPPNAAS